MSNAGSSGAGPISIPNRDLTAALVVEVTQQALVPERILGCVFCPWRSEVPSDSASNPWAQQRATAVRAPEILIREQEIRETLGDNALEMSASSMLSWTSSGAFSLGAPKHDREAVGAAALQLNAVTQNKAGRRDISDTDLFKRALSVDDAKPSRSTLRRMPLEDCDTYRPVRRRAKALAGGTFAGIRSPFRHEGLNQEFDEQAASGYLTTLGVLARCVDESIAERAGDAA